MISIPGGGQRTSMTEDHSTDISSAQQATESGPIPDIDWQSGIPDTFGYQLLEGLDEAFLIADTHGKLRFANQAARRIFGLKGRVAGRHLPGVLADRAALTLVEQAATSSRPLTAALSLTLSSEGAKSFIFGVTAIHAPGGEVLLRIQLRPAPELPHEAEAGQISDLAAGLEKLSDPLTIIQGYLENLLDGVIRDPVVMRQCLAAMQRQTSQIQRVLGTLRR